MNFYQDPAPTPFVTVGNTGLHQPQLQQSIGEELCDVCYWRNIAETRLQKINQLEKAGDELLEWLTIDGVSLSNQRLLANQWCRAKGVKK